MIGGSPVTVETGEILLLPASIPHAIVAEKPFKRLPTMIRG